MPNEEIKFIDGDIVRVHPISAPNQVVLSQPHLLENSLIQFFKFMFLKHPPFLRLSINSKSISQPIENPYNVLRPLTQNRDNILQFKQSEFAAQILTPTFQ